jgi:serine/threonine-protein kinase
MTPELLSSAVLQILRALSVAHSKGFVHRDIKPANIFLVGTGEDLDAKLLDFGIARTMGREASDVRLTKAGAVIGTPFYMSPEQMSGEEVDGRADLWAVGVVMYFALTKEMPYRAKNYGALLAEMVNAGAPSLAERRPDLPAATIRTVDRALAKDLAERFGSAGEMAASLRGPPVPKRSVKPPPPRHKWQDALEGIELEIEALEAKKKKS